MENDHFKKPQIKWLIENIEFPFIEEKDGKYLLTDFAKHNIQKAWSYLNLKIEGSDKAFYGINTGFGSLCNIVIEKQELGTLQENLIKSHACGMGEEVPREIVELILFLKIQSLSYGHSGVHIHTVERLLFHFNHRILPVLYEQGSLGASGDLAPLAHLSLPLIGLGEVYLNDKKSKTQESFDLPPLKLGPKEGLALLNGTQFMQGYGIFIVHQAEKLMALINKISALSCEAWDCKIEPFLPQIHHIRKQPFQAVVANELKSYLGNSPQVNAEKKQTQDPYSFRCIPQVHGASWGAIEHVKQVFVNEINSVTDNPNIFPEEDLILSGGNFHGQALALALDYLALALAELGSISERRIYNLISGQRGLPPFLSQNPGVNSGFMIVQYTAAGIVSQNKQYCTPTSVDSIVSSNGQEDHVSMGANAATKCLKVLENLKSIIALELVTACQAMELKRPLTTSPELEIMIESVRESVPFVKEDIVMFEILNKGKEWLNASLKN